MDKFELVIPDIVDKEKVMEYLKEHIENKENIIFGSNRLEKYINYEEWIENTIKDSKGEFLNKVPATLFLFKRAEHKKFGLMWECNGGSILAGETSLDGVIRELKEELDCYVLGVDEPIESFDGKCIAVIHRTNDNDDKLVIAPEGKEYTDEEIRKLTNFQEQYFESEIIR